MGPSTGEPVVSDPAEGGTDREYQSIFDSVEANVQGGQWNTPNRVVAVDGIPEATYERATNPQRFEPHIAAARAGG